MDNINSPMELFITLYKGGRGISPAVVGRLTRHLMSILLFSLLIITGSLSAQQALTLLTLDDCIKIGLEKSTEILKSNNAQKLTGVQLMAAYGQFLPDLNFGANYTFNGGKNLYTTTIPTLVDSRQNILTYQLMSSINIFNGLSDYSALKAATLTKSAAELNTQRVRQSIAFDIAQSYLQVVLDRRVTEYARQNLKTSTDRESQLTELTNVGRKALSDLYQQQAETSSDKLFLIQSEQKVKDDKVLLLRKIRITDPDRYEIADVISDTVPLGPDYQNVEILIAKALDQRPDLKSSELSMKIADWNIKQYKSGYYPKLNVNYGLVSNGSYLDRLYVDGVNDLADQTEPLGKALFGQVYGTVGIGLSWRLFDKLVTKTNVDAYKIYRSNAEIDRDDLRVQITADIRQAFDDYVSALQQIETSDIGILAARQSFDVIQGRYAVGSSTFVDISNAQAVLLQAQVSRIQALIKLSLQKKVIDYSLGN
jgi:outer membrane protein